MSSTLSQLTNRTLARLSQVEGTGTQIYAEDTIAEMIQHKFDVLFEEFWWDQFLTVGQSMTLDGTLGEVTTDLTDLIKSIDHIQAMWPENSDSQITKLPSTVNVANYSGTSPVVYGANTDAAKVFTIWPKTATGNIIVNFATKPDNFTANDTINFDDQLLILGAAYDYLEDDGTNPNATQKMLNMYNARVSQFRQRLNRAPIPLDATQPIYPNGFELTRL